MSENIFVGIDCGASKILSQAAKIDYKLDLVIPTGKTDEKEYSANINWNNEFRPVPIKIQLEEFINQKINLTSEEISQGDIIFDFIKKILKKNDKDKVSICYPGLKSKEGVPVMVNGPRIPNLIKNLNYFKHFYNDSDCCTIGEWKSSIGKMTNIKNGIYLGGGTGIADGLIINGEMVDFNVENDIRRSWQIVFEGKTIESMLSPFGMIKSFNRRFNKSIGTLDELINSKFSAAILIEASNAFSELIKDRTEIFNSKGQHPERIIIGQRLGIFLDQLDNKIKDIFLNCSKIPLSFSTDRRTAALGAIYKMLNC
jgi:hypothetical protein